MSDDARQRLSLPGVDDPKMERIAMTQPTTPINLIGACRDMSEARNRMEDLGLRIRRTRKHLASPNRMSRLGEAYLARLQANYRSASEDLRSARGQVLRQLVVGQTVPYGRVRLGQRGPRGADITGRDLA